MPEGEAGEWLTWPSQALQGAQRQRLVKEGHLRYPPEWIEIEREGSGFCCLGAGRGRGIEKTE